MANNLTRSKSIILSLLIPIFIVNVVKSQSKIWIGGDGDFMDGAMWSPAGTPDSDDLLRIFSGEVVLNGTVQIQRLIATGSSEVHIAAGAKLNIFDSPTLGLQCNTSGSFIIDGELRIEDSEDQGMWVQKNMTVGVSGEIFIKNVSTAINIFPDDTLFNHGNIEIDSTGSIGLSNSGVLFNYEDAEISNTNGGYFCADFAVTHNYGNILNDASGIYSTKTGIFYNYAGGTFIATNSSGRGCSAVKMYNYSGSLLNISDSGIDGVGVGLHIADEDSLFNYGVININKSAGRGIEIRGHLNNSAGGVISASESGKFAFGSALDISATGSLENDGNITLDESSRSILENDGILNNKLNGVISISNGPREGLINNGSLVNNNQLNIINSGSSGLINNGDITNDMNGNIAIVNSNSHGIEIRSSSFLENMGSLTVNQSERLGLSLQGTLNTVNGSTFSISNSGTRGIETFSGSSILSAGTITVNNSSSHGLFNKGSITNNATGVMSFSNSGFYGMYFLGGTTTNYGILSTQNSSFDSFLNEGALILKENSEAYINN